MRLRHCLIQFCTAAMLAASASAAGLPAGGLFPANGATGVCADANLRIAFPAAPKLGTAGTIQIFDAASDQQVATVDLTNQILSQNIGGLGAFKYRTILPADNQITIALPNHALAYGKTYYVKIDGGVFDGIDAVSDSKSWRFSTRPTPPAAKAGRLTVAADGSGDFCTVQGAIDSIPEGNKTPKTIFIRNGTYTELVCLFKRDGITLLGEDRKQTIIEYTNNERFNPIQGNPFGGDHPDPTSFDPLKNEPVYHRGLVTGHAVNDLTIANLTLHNTTPQGGSQSESIILNGTTTAHAILKDVDLYSFQDTLQINGQAYISNCFIKGDVDFMWGTGPCFFENCTATSPRSRAYYTQIRNQPTNHGYVFYKTKFEGADNVTGMFFSRIATGKYPASEVVLIDCVLTDAVGAVGWQLQGGGNTPTLHFWEFNSLSPDGKPVDVSTRADFSKQLKQPDDAATIANYSDPKFVLGGGWDPKAAPIFSAKPTP